MQERFPADGSCPRFPDNCAGLNESTFLQNSLPLLAFNQKILQVGLPDMAEVELNTFGQCFLCPVVFHYIVRKRFGEVFSWSQLNLDTLKKLVGVGTAQTCLPLILFGIGLRLGADMLKIINSPHNHFATGR